MRLTGPRRQSGFTLVELVISAGLMSIVLASSYLCLSAGVAGKKLIDGRADAAQSGRTALAAMAADIRAAVPLPGQTEMVGLRRTLGGANADNLDFATRNYTPRQPREADQIEISYFLTRDPQSDSFILARRRDPTPDPEPLEGGAREEIARGVHGLLFEYYDGFEWYEEWGDPDGKTRGMLFPPSNSYGLPEAVRITIAFDPEDLKAQRAGDGGESEAPKKSPITFQTTVRLDLAPTFNRQAVSQRNSSAGAQPAPPEGGQQ